jgi:SAM-dependent methyltransferase
MDISKHRNPDIVGDICQSSFNEAFDAVICMEVLEHIPTPHLAMEKIFLALKPGGALIMSVPFLFPLHDRPHDYFRYTKYGLKYLLRDFEQVMVSERNGWAECLCVLLVRCMFSNGKDRLFFRVLLVITGIALYPLAQLIQKCWCSDFIANGYHVSAIRPKHSGNTER